MLVRYRHERGESTYKANVRGDRRQPRAALPRDRLGVHQGRAREVHGHPAVPDVRRQAAPAGDPRGHDRRPEHLGRRDACRSPTRCAGRPASRPTLDERERTIAYQVSRRSSRGSGSSSTSGLDYLTLDRTSVTLSGGEAQRIRLATQIGTTLMGVLYILDEPSIGLHQRDNAKLIATLTRLRDLGNTVLVVEHDEETIRTADWVVDIGPGAGEHGGEIIVERHARGPPRRAALDHRGVPPRRARGADPDEAAQGQRQDAPRDGRARAQPARRRPHGAARDVRGGHRRVAGAARARS